MNVNKIQRNLKGKTKGLVLLLLILGLSFNASSNSNLVCEDATVHDSAYGMSNTQLNRFESNLTENRNRGVSYRDKVKRVKEAVEYRNGNLGFPAGHDSQSIAEAAVWAANCTGNDFTVFAAILSVESGYCGDLVGGGSDSGCSQLSARRGASVHELKSQLNISGGDGSANPDVTRAARNMVLSCFNNDRTQYNAFMEFYGRTFDEIKRDLRRGTNVYFDVLMGAIYLKFVTSLAGGYMVPGDAPGGIARYNGGGVPNYLGKVQGTGQAEGRLEQISGSCYQDNFSPNVLGEACGTMGLQGALCNSVSGIEI